MKSNTDYAPFNYPRESKLWEWFLYGISFGFICGAVLTGIAMWAIVFVWRMFN